ncbi:MAG: flavin reductase family protein [bacterium]
MEWDPARRDAKANYRFLVTAVAPRPIAWVTTVDGAGVVNAAPFSWFNTICPDPPMVMLAVGHRPDGSPKDTVRNIRHTGEFVVNVVTRDLAEPMVASSADYAPGQSEVEALHLATAPSRVVRPPRLAASPVHLECRLERILPIGRNDNHMLVLGAVVHIACDDAVLDARGNVDPAKVTLVGRWGGANYVATEHAFQVPWPQDPGDAMRKPR